MTTVLERLTSGLRAAFANGGAGVQGLTVESFAPLVEAALVRYADVVDRDPTIAEPLRRWPRAVLAADDPIAELANVPGPVHGIGSDGGDVSIILLAIALTPPWRARHGVSSLLSQETDALNNHARDALRRAEGKTKETIEGRERAEELLASALREALREFLPMLETIEGAVEIDARLVAYLEKLGGKEAKKAAKALRGAANPRDYEAWNTGKRVVLLAHVLWVDDVAAQYERERRKPAALAFAVHEPTVHLFSSVRRAEERNGQLGLRLPGDMLVQVNMAAAVDASALHAMLVSPRRVDEGLKLFGKLTSHRILRHLIFSSHRQAIEANPDPRVIRIDGAYRAYTELLGMRGNRAAEEVRAVLEAMHVTELPLPPDGRYQRLLTLDAHTSRGRGDQWIKILVGFPLLPDYVQELQLATRGSLEGRRASRLVPILDLPPPVGRDNEHGAQATLSMLLVAHLRDHARDLVERGGVLLSDALLAELATTAGLGAQSVRPILDRWAHDGDDGPAFLKRTRSGRYTLGDAHKLQREFIEEGGRRELEGSAAGRDGAEKRRAKLRRTGKP